MKIKFDNVNFLSQTGPNSFGLELAMELKKQDCQLDVETPDVQLSFIQIINKKNIPNVLRLDGIYHNIKQNYLFQNAPIQESYNIADACIIQSNFDKKLINSFFGERKNCFVINNGTDLSEIEKTPPSKIKKFDEYETIWCSASHFSGRGHKRLSENIRYFLEHSSPKDLMVIMGDVDEQIENDRVFYTGNVPRGVMISIMKRSKNFVFLSYCDHCPNVVVDARAAGNHIICSDQGGTIEIAGSKATIIEDEPFGFAPIDLYNPPSLDFSKKNVVDKPIDNSDIDIKIVAEKYLEVFKKVLK